MRERQGKSARLAEAEFDKTVANQADDRTAAQIADEEQKKIADEEQKLDGDKAAKDDALNQSDTEEIDTEVKKETKKPPKTTSIVPKMISPMAPLPMTKSMKVATTKPLCPPKRSKKKPILTESSSLK